MKFCGACILTDNVPRLVDFYKVIFRSEPNGDEIHSSFDDFQLAIWNSGTVKVVKDKNMSLMYFVEDADAEYERLQQSNLEITFISAPTVKPWGVKSFAFLDPDGNEINFLAAVK